jgi:hypothetical protein
MAGIKSDRRLSPEQEQNILTILKNRFEKNMMRHKGADWQAVQEKLATNYEKLWSLNEMERTGGEPDVIGSGSHPMTFVFADCSAESPAGRRGTSYDRQGQMSRKEAIPEHNATDMAAEMGIEMLDEEQYRQLQGLGEFDLKTSSWVKTPEEVRKLGGAIFGDRRYGRVFVYHNGAQSYYSARGFRGILKV